MDKPMRILFSGVGGQGTLTASSLLAQAAIREGKEAILSEVHGMAQRGGVVESTVMIGGIKSAIISDGEADVLVSFEPLEAIRALIKCHKNCCIITNINPIIPFTVDIGGPQYPDVNYCLSKMKETFRKVIAIDADSIADKSGTKKAVNVVLLGVLFGTNILPISRNSMIETIKERVKPKFIDANIKAFEMGLEMV